METFEIVAYSVLFGLNVLFGWLGARWVKKKGHPELTWVIWLVSLLAGFFWALIIVSFLPAKARRVPRRQLMRSPGHKPNLRMPKPRGPLASQTE